METSLIEEIRSTRQSYQPPSRRKTPKIRFSTLIRECISFFKRFLSLSSIVHSPYTRNRAKDRFGEVAWDQKKLCDIWAVKIQNVVRKFVKPPKSKQKLENIVFWREKMHPNDISSKIYDFPENFQFVVGKRHFFRLCFVSAFGG